MIGSSRPAFLLDVDKLNRLIRDLEEVVSKNKNSGGPNEFPEVLSSHMSELIFLIRKIERHKERVFNQED